MDIDFDDVCQPEVCKADPHLIEIQCRNVLHSLEILRGIFGYFLPAIERIDHVIYQVELLQNRYGPERERQREKSEKELAWVKHYHRNALKPTPAGNKDC